MSETREPSICDRTPRCEKLDGHFGRCVVDGVEVSLGFAGRTPDGEEELGGIGIAGISQRYRLVDGRLEIWFASDRTWIRQARSEWSTREKWANEVGHLRLRLHVAKCVLSLFPDPSSDATGPQAPSSDAKE